MPPNAHDSLDVRTFAGCLPAAALPVDLHAHVVPGVDDGPATYAESVDLCVSLGTEGVREVVATPHVTPRWRTDPDERDRRIQRLARRLEAVGVEIVVHSGGELALEFAVGWSDQQLRHYSPGGARLLLVESPWEVFPGDADECLRRLHRRGWRPLLAHPERCTEIQRQPKRLDPLLDAGASCQVSTGSLTGCFGEAAAQTAFELVRTGRATCVASDAHHALSRPPGIEAAWEACRRAGVGQATLHRLFAEAPARLLHGGVASSPRLDPLVRRSCARPLGQSGEISKAPQPILR